MNTKIFKENYSPIYFAINPKWFLQTLCTSQWPQPTSSKGKDNIQGKNWLFMTK